MTNSRPIASLPGWKKGVDHLEAERLLKDQKPGTYLVRKGDLITKNIEELLARENHTAIHCYIITIKEKENAIKELMLVQTEKGWILYDDNPDLTSKSYRVFSSIHQLLTSLKGQAKYPLKK
ncbi:MAG: SH2 domain-containing protein [Chlamydiota bacterium]|jgi:hypothetical protein